MTAESIPVPGQWATEACTLPTAEQPLRLAEFDTLFATALHGLRRVGPRHVQLVFVGPAGLEDSVRDLAARENACCSFFTFTVDSPTPGRVLLEVEVPPTHVGILDALTGRATSVRVAT